MSKEPKKTTRPRHSKAIRPRKVRQPIQRKPTPASADRPPTKIATILALLSRPQGVTIGELVRATGWLKHSVRGALAGVIRNKLGIAVIRERADSSSRYRIATKGNGELKESAGNGRR
jgi:hypothetical protein